MTTPSESGAREILSLEAAVCLQGRWEIAGLSPTGARWRPWRASLTSPDPELAGYVVVATLDVSGAVSLSEAHRRRTVGEQAQVLARLAVATLALLAGFGWFVTVLPVLIGTLAGWGAGGSWPMTELAAAASPIGLGAFLWARSDHFDAWTCADPAERRVHAGPPAY